MFWGSHIVGLIYVFYMSEFFFVCMYMLLVLRLVEVQILKRPLD